MAIEGGATGVVDDSPIKTAAAIEMRDRAQEKLVRDQRCKCGGVPLFKMVALVIKEDGVEAQR